MRDPNQAIGANLPVTFHPQTGLPQAISLGVQQNPVRYQPNLNDPALAGLPPALAGQYAMQKLGPNPPSQAQIGNAQKATQQSPTGNPDFPTAPAGFDANWYLQNNPDIMAGYNSQKDKQEGPEWYALWHYNTHGKNEGRQYKPPTDGGAAPAQAAPATATGGIPANLSPESIMNLMNLLKGMGIQ